MAHRIPAWLYELVAKDARFQCGYCRCPQQVLPYRLEIEHLQPISLGGTYGDVILRRQVSTRSRKLQEFQEQLHQAGAEDEQ
ncbi:MAG: hypothetical protein GXY83_40930 [Rhodopirellula sp.]|nr:hypothetical protein [Rhodopirellula sp.]